MKKLSNKTVVLIAAAPLAVYFVTGFIEGALGVSGLLPGIVLTILDLIAFVFTVYAFIRLYNLPDPTPHSPLPTAQSTTPTEDQQQI